MVQMSVCVTAMQKRRGVACGGERIDTGLKQVPQSHFSSRSAIRTNRPADQSTTRDRQTVMQTGRAGRF